MPTNKEVDERAACLLSNGTAGEVVMNLLRSHYFDAASQTVKLASLNAATTRIRKLAAAPKSFRLSREEVLAFKRRGEDAVLAKSESPILIPNGDELVSMITGMLETATVHTSNPKLIFPLLLASGRRLTEILSPRSVFSPHPHPFYTRFSGQLKKRGAASTYTIPLLVPYTTFATGLLALRQKQGNALHHFTNQQLYNRYHGQISRHLHRTLPLPNECHVHTLRALYASLVYELYEVPCIFARMCMHVLGHELLRESLTYSCVRVEGVACKGRYGPLHIGE